MGEAEATRGLSEGYAGAMQGLRGWRAGFTHWPRPGQAETINYNCTK